MNLFDWLSTMPKGYQMVFFPLLGLVGISLITMNIRRLLSKKIRFGKFTMTQERRVSDRKKDGEHK